MADRYVHHTLTVNYRTTAEILEAARPTLARIAPTQGISRSIRHGVAPTSISVAAGDLDTTLGDLVARLREDDPDELLGIIAASSRAHRIEHESFSRDATIVAAPQARGLEFDTVIIIDPSGIQAESGAGLQDLYVAQTRATTRLVTLHIDPAETAAFSE